MSTYVLVHGGGHGGWCWRWLTPLLRAAGHDVFAPTLTGVSDRAHARLPGINLDTNIEDIASLLVHEDLTEVILVGHSYGGMVITGVADRGVELALHPLPEMGRLFGIEDPDLLAWFQERVTPHPWACFTQPLVLNDEDAVRAIPRTDFRCINALRAAEEPSTVRQQDVGANLRNVFYLETGHDLMITAPEQVAELMVKIQ